MRIPSSAMLIVATAAALFSAACGSSSEGPPTVVVDQTPAGVAASGSIPSTAAAGSAVASPVVVKVTNRAGATVSGASVTFRVTTGGGAVNPATATSDGQGLASTTWTLGAIAGPQTLTAAVNDLPVVTFTTTAVAAAASVISKVAGDAQTADVGAAVTVAPAVRLLDAAGNPVADAAVTFSVSSGGGSVSGATTRTAADGVARVGAWTLGTAAGRNVLEVSAGGSIVTTFTANAIAGPPSTLTFGAPLPSEMRIADTFDLRTTARDRFQNVNTTAAMTYTVTPASAASVDANGRVAVLTAGRFTVRATSGTATASSASSVIGHPVGTAIVARFDPHAAPEAITVTDSAIWTLSVDGFPRRLVRRSYDGVPQAPEVPIEFISEDYVILAPMKRGNTVIVASRGLIATSYWFIDIATNRKIDSLNTQRYLQAGAMSSDGTRAYFVLDAGELAVMNVATRTFLPSIPLGAGITSFKIAPGDSIAFARTSIGTMMEIDLLRGNVRRQYTMKAYTDFDVSPDLSTFYVVDQPEFLIRALRTSDLSETASALIVGNRIAIAPDGRALFVTTLTMFNVTPTGLTRGTTYFSVSGSRRLVFNSDGSALVIVRFDGVIEVLR